MNPAVLILIILLLGFDLTEQLKTRRGPRQQLTTSDRAKTFA